MLTYDINYANCEQNSLFCFFCDTIKKIKVLDEMGTDKSTISWVNSLPAGHFKAHYLPRLSGIFSLEKLI